MSDHLVIVLSNAAPGREDEFNEWYTNEHIPHVVDRMPGYESGQRYELAADQLMAGQFKYLAVYRIPEDKLAEAQKAIADQRVERAAAEAAGREPMITTSSAMADPHFVWLYSPITEEYRSAGGATD